MKVLKHVFVYLVFHNIQEYQYLRNLDYYEQKYLLHIFRLTICSNGLLNYIFNLNLSQL